jgi:hypothetical protein
MGVVDTASASPAAIKRKQVVLLMGLSVLMEQSQHLPVQSGSKNGGAISG